VARIDLAVSVSEGPCRELTLEDPLLIVAGYTGRDPASVEHHIRELELIGVAPPRRVPSFFPVPNWLLHVSPVALQVTSPATSGEAEPVLIRTADGELFLGVGSDHTDRKLETLSVAASKVACPKIIAPTVWPLDEVADEWDRLELTAVSGTGGAPYQRGVLAGLRSPLELLADSGGLDGGRPNPTVLFLGTLPLLNDGFRYDDSFTVELVDRSRDRGLTCRYRVLDVSAALRSGS
jgi:Protein of unknown function (DUF2848)